MRSVRLLLRHVSRYLWQYGVCSWLHRRHRCYPGVDDPALELWHCQRCHPCVEGLIRLGIVPREEVVR